MEFALTKALRIGGCLAIILLMLASTASFAQNVRLSAEQQQMLNTLPPAQRQQALNAIRAMQSQDSSPSMESINEVDDSESTVPTNRPFEPAVTEDEPRADSRSRLVINFSAAENMTAQDVAELDADTALQRLVGSHLFVLDDAGVLTLQGLELIPLLGLDEEDIKRRLQAEPYLSKFDIDVRILDQEPIGVEALKPFGYDVFEQRETGFESPSTGPVPANYVLGPGDRVRVQFFGNVNEPGNYEYEVSRDGILDISNIGPVTVAGMSFSEFRADLNKRVQETLIGTQVSVSMGQLRTMRVYVLGDVQQPGSYVVNGLSTISAALFLSRGVSEIGTLRDIQLKRSGRVVSRLDFYDLLINGDSSDDRRLQPGDIVFVPPIGNTISIGGAVKRPAIYETRSGATIADALKLAGGLTADALAAGARLERVDSNRGRIVQSVDLRSSVAVSTKVGNGGTLLVPEILPDLGSAVVLSGHVHRPGTYAWRPEMHLSDLIASPNELKAGVDMNYVLVRRERERGKPIEAVSADLAKALANRRSSFDIALEPRDQVHVFSLELGRQRTVGPIVEELQRQATHDAPALQVEIGGDVRAPGIYPLEAGMRVSDLIRAGGSLSEEAYALDAELTRYSVVAGASRVVGVREVDLAGVIRGEENADIVLAPYDHLSISKVPEWDTTWTVSLEGELQFPGDYRIKRGETLADVLRRAGGLTDAAFPEGAVFLRESLKEREQEQVELLARRLEADLTSLSLQLADSGSGSDTLTTGRALLEQLRSTEAVGRLVINTQHLTSASSRAELAASIELRDGDRLLVPPMSQVVSVIGETQQNTSHLFAPDLSRNDYINLSGGLTRRADKRRIYVVRANGAVIVRNRSRWLGRGGHIEVRPGDTIVVPLDADKIRPLTFWTNVTQILYQGAIAVAAVKTFDD